MTNASKNWCRAALRNGGNEVAWGEREKALCCGDVSVIN